MLQDFLGQFIGQIPPILLILVCGGPFLVAGLLWYFRRQGKIRKQRQRELLLRSTGNDTVPVEVNAEDDHRWMTVEEEPRISQVSPPVNDPADDPLALLAQARAEAEELGEIPEPTPEPPPSTMPEPRVPSVPVAAPAPVQQPAPQPVMPSTVHLITSLPILTRLENGETIRSREILSILRDQFDQRLMVQMADTGYRSLSEDPDAREQFKRVMKELSGTIMQPDDGAETTVEETGELHMITLQPMKVQLSNGAMTTVREILSVQRDLGDKRLLIQIGGVAYRTLAEDPDAREQFKRVMKELSGTIMQPDDAPPPLVTPTPAQTPPAAQSASVADLMASTTPPPAANVDEEEEEERPRLPGDLPSMTLDEESDSYKRTRYGYVRVTKIDKAPEINIADAIEEYLQYKISQLPQFQQRGIHIKSAATGGVRIELEGQSYDFVDEVPDDAVRQLLQESIDEWQERH